MLFRSMKILLYLGLLAAGNWSKTMHVAVRASPHEMLVALKLRQCSNQNQYKSQI